MCGKQLFIITGLTVCVSKVVRSCQHVFQKSGGSEKYVFQLVE